MPQQLAKLLMLELGQLLARPDTARNQLSGAPVDNIGVQRREGRWAVLMWFVGLCHRHLHRTKQRPPFDVR